MFGGALIFIRVLRMSNERGCLLCEKPLMLHYCIMHKLTIQISPATKPLCSGPDF